MHITIDDETVRKNIYSFLELLRQSEAKREKKGEALIEKSYLAYINRNSGKIVFPEEFRIKQDFLERDWKPLYLEYAYDTDTESFHAITYEGTDTKTAFNFNDLTSTAYKTLKETVVILNKLSDLLKGPGSDIITKVKAICKVNIEIGQEGKDRNLIYATWHPVDRRGAEKLLKGKPFGTFLFREDYFAKLLGDQLSNQLGKDVKCVTLSLAGKESQIQEFTLVHIDHQWRWYDDALFCNVQGFEEINDLLKVQFKDKATIPLYNKFIEGERLAQ